LAQPDEDRVELRLMSDPVFTEEFDIVVDEIAALYVGDQFKGEEKARVEQYFLKSPDRQNKLKFMGEFLRQIANTQRQEPVKGAPAVVVVPPKPGLFERVRSWWSSQSISLRAATTFATLVILAGAVFLLLPGGVSEPTYASLELAMTSSERSTGAQIPKVNLSSGTDELRIQLQVPDDAPPANSYHAQLRGEKVSRQLSVQQQDSKSLKVVVPANELPRGSYAIELTAVLANGTEVPLRGAYLFAVE
jgi:hypothetical protein